MGSRTTNILVVEDEEAHVELIRRAFGMRSAQTSITVARTLYRARCYIAESPPALVIADLFLPDGKGTELLPREGDTSAPPVLIMTGQGDERVAVEAIKLGALDYVVKSAAVLADMPHIADRALREWNHIIQHKRAEAEREQLHSQLRQAQKMEALGQLAGGIAHDFNNLLTAILLSVDMALESLSEPSAAQAPETVKDLLEQIRQAGQRGASLIRQLLTFSRKQVAKPEVLDLNRIVTDIEKLLRRLIDEHIELKTVPGPDLRGIHADANQIGQVIMNLVLNACDAMPSGGTLTLSTANVDLDQAYVAGHLGAKSGPHVMLAVRDTGVGMDEPHRSRLFEPFFTTKPVGHGTGLGLATVYGIVTQAGGHIAVSSELGKGSVFNVFFPATAAAEIQPAVQSTPAGLRGEETILVCEDEELVRRLTCRVLESGGYTVLEASNGTRALEVIAAHKEPIQLVISDVAMPGLSGWDLAEIVTARHDGTRVLLVSGYASGLPPTHQDPRRNFEFFQKPFAPTDLLQRVREILNKS